MFSRCVEKFEKILFDVLMKNSMLTKIQKIHNNKLNYVKNVAQKSTKNRFAIPLLFK